MYNLILLANISLWCNSEESVYGTEVPWPFGRACALQLARGF